ncbi:spore germination protein GerW family protein [Bacillus sp. 2205SS5-2]|uniref:spore germination protein GerW family protein n=1 Tax=Bacillus sp. 2205SS5-2 TaxID=3109031 RepID=UPI0030050B86
MEKESVSSMSEQIANTNITPIGIIFNKFSMQKDVTLVYGESIDFGNKRVIPVAKISYSVGGGGGYAGENDGSSASKGEGGGGHISVTPVGVYEISSKRTKFKPIIDLKLLLSLFSVFSFGLIWLIKKVQ